MVAINTIKMSESDPEDERRRAILRQQAYADLLAQTAQRAGGDKVYGHGLGIAKVGGAALAGLWGRQADEQERSEEAMANELIAGKVGKAFGGGADTVSPGDTGEASLPPGPAAPSMAGGGARRTMDAGRVQQAGEIYQGLIKRGVPSMVAAGLVGQTGSESSVNPGAVGDGGTSVGLWQHHADRAQALRQRAQQAGKPWQDREVQMDHVVAELNGPERAAYDAARSARTPEESAAILASKFERPQAEALARTLGARQSLARQVYGGAAVSGGGGSPTMAGGSGGGSGISAQDVQELVRNPRTRSYGLALYNAHVQEIAQRQAAQAELAKEGRGEARDLRKLEAERQPLPEATIQQQIAKARESRPQTNVTVGAGETEELKTRGKDLAGRLGKIAEDGDKAGVDLITLQRLQQLSQAVEPGAKTALMEEIRQRTGIQLDPNADNVQAFQAAVAKLIPNMRPEGSGGNSDKDMALFGQAAPSLMGTPGGNEIVMQTLGGLAQHRAARGDIAKSYQFGDLSAKQANEEMAKLGDPFAAFKEYQAKTAAPGRSAAPSVAGPNGPVRVRTPEEADRLPPGIQFVLPDGRIGTVPPPLAPAVPTGPTLPGSGPIRGAPSASRGAMPYSAYPTAGIRG